MTTNKLTAGRCFYPVHTAAHIARAVAQNCFPLFRGFAIHRAAMLVVFVIAAAIPLAAHAAVCNINMGTNQQVIDGYGFSSAWCGTLSAAKNDALYNTLGFSLLRIRIDPNQNWSEETANASAAHAHGAKVLGTPWTPPAYMKDNGSNVHGSLLTSQYAAYANYLNQAATNIGLDYVSLQNEPDWNPDYEGCVWNGTQFRNFCYSNAQVITKPIVMPEALGFNDAMSDPTLNDPTAASRVTIVAGHFYGSGNYVHQNALNKGKRVWETENYETGGQSDFSVCMKVAKTVSDAMNNQFSAYFWWWVNDSQSDGTTLVNNSGTIIKPGYILGQFAKWVRPGANRVTADYNPTANIYVTAYKVAGGTNLVIVALNTGNSQVVQQFNIANGTVAMLEGYRTSSSESMADVGGYAVSAGGFTAPLPAQSVTTFVQTGGPGTPAAPSNLVVTAVSGSQIDLAWTTNATNATAYLVERSSDNIIFSQFASLGASATNFSNTGLPGSTTYYYRVRAGNNGVFSLYSNTTNATTLLGVSAAPTGLTGVAGNGRATLTWNVSGGTPATGYNVKRSTTSGGPYTTIATLTGTNFIDTPLSNLTAYNYVVAGTNSYGSSSNSTQITLTPLPTALPLPWQDRDIGSVGQIGRASFSNTIVTVTGSGADIWGTADAFHYAYFLATNDCTIIARVTSVENTDPWAKAGVMIRASLAAGSPHAMMIMSAGNGAAFQWRSATNGTSSQSQSGGLSAPYWVKLVRSGNSFRGYVSPDGGAWTQVGSSQTITMPGPVYVGLPVTAHDNADSCTAVFDNVWSTAPIGTWQHQDIGSVGFAGSASDSTSPFSVTGAGADIWGTADGFHFAFVPATNNCAIIARVTAEQNINVWSKAGVMIRESLSADSVNAFIAVTPSNGVTFQYRSSPAGNSLNSPTAGFTVPYWVKLVRSGNTFTGYRSPDGVNWTQQGSSATITMASAVYAGLAVTSHDSSTACTAAFDNVSVPGWTNANSLSAPTNLTASVVNWNVNLNWPAVSGATNYNVKRATSVGGPYDIIATVSVTNFTDSPNAGPTYYYVVSALSAGGESGNSVEASVNSQTLGPSGFSAVAISPSRINLSWNAFPSATSYNIKRALTNSGPYATIASSVSGTSYSDTAVTSGATYYYVISANVSGSETLNSLQASAVAAIAISPTLISAGAVWRYFDKTNDLGTTWRSNAFSDATWSNGPARLGFGNDGEVTKVASNRQWTTYFRQQFYVPNPSQVTALSARLTRDDAAVIYLNGAEIWRDTNFASGVITNQTPALIALGSPDETNWFTLNLGASTPSLLLPGWNLLAAEVHNQSLTSSDLGYNFELTGNVLVTSLPTVKLGVSGGALLLDWPEEASYFSLYAATNLTSPVTWARVTNSSALVNGRWQVTLPAAATGQRFFSLQQP